MSTPSCILLFLLCLSLHACSARRLGAVNNKKKLHFSIENEMKNGLKKNPVVVLHEKSSSSKDLQSIKQESINGVAEVKHKRVVEKEKEKGSSGVSVTWRVPRKKHGEKNPGFNLDYSPPKTHPPSHN